MKIHVVKAGDTLFELAKKYNVHLDKLIAANPGLADPDKLEIGMKIKIPTGSTPVTPEGMHAHTVKQGDTMWKLSKAWGVSLKSLIDANPHITNPNILMTGQVVHIPKQTGASGSSPNENLAASGISPKANTAPFIQAPKTSTAPVGQAPKAITAPVVKEPTAPKPVEEKPVEEKPVEEKPVEEKPLEEKPVEAKPEENVKPIENVKPAEVKPVENVKPAEVKPVENVKPVEVKPIENVKPAEVKPVENVKPAEVKPIENVKPQVKPLEYEKPQVKPLEYEKPQVKPMEYEKPQVKPMEYEKPSQISPSFVKPAASLKLPQIPTIADIPEYPQTAVGFPPSAYSSETPAASMYQSEHLFMQYQVPAVEAYSDTGAAAPISAGSSNWPGYAPLAENNVNPLATAPAASKDNASFMPYSFGQQPLYSADQAPAPGACGNYPPAVSPYAGSQATCGCQGGSGSMPYGYPQANAVSPYGYYPWTDGGNNAPFLPQAVAEAENAPYLPQFVGGAENASFSPYSMPGAENASFSPYSMPGAENASFSPYSMPGKENASFSPYSVAGTESAPFAPYSMPGTENASFAPYSVAGTESAPFAPYSVAGKENASFSPYSMPGTENTPLSPYSTAGAAGAPADYSQYFAPSMPEFNPYSNLMPSSMENAAFQPYASYENQAAPFAAENGKPELEAAGTGKPGAVDSMYGYPTTGFPGMYPEMAGGSYPGGGLFPSGVPGVYNPSTGPIPYPTGMYGFQPIYRDDSVGPVATVSQGTKTFTDEEESSSQKPAVKKSKSSGKVSLHTLARRSKRVTVKPERSNNPWINQYR